ncbi:MAG: ATP-dependent acyl-CoA ligase [Robiginitomaculum sp.]|nr:MAG: ATP-dependent acyl-CoA ligase [Robiginitomaculum sp.]
MSILLSPPLEYSNVSALFKATAKAYAKRPFLNILFETAKAYNIPSGEISYGSIQTAASILYKAYKHAGYGHGHRVGILLENRPEFFEHWLALNALGVSIVPINPELRTAELEYLISHSEMILAVALPNRHDDLNKAAPDGLVVISANDTIPMAIHTARTGKISHNTEAALLYTSGTTGLPKGCVLTNAYFLNCGQWYRDVGGYCEIFETRPNGEGERMITPLPLFHMNALACSSLGMMAVGGCVSFLDRFHPRSWWASVAQSEASIIHYLGVMPAMLMGAQPSAEDTAHCVRFGFGAGVDRALHAPFEKRYGFPLIEAWAMSETGDGAVIAASEDPRHVGTNCFGTPSKDIEVKLVTDDGQTAPIGTHGELLVRGAGEDPKFGFFDRYLKNPQATAEAWEGGWFHTGDIACENQDGSFTFIDRKKNVIRRSGENIAAVEVENALLQHEEIEAIAIAATPDSVRGDEVFALVVSKGRAGSQAFAEDIVRYSLSHLAYYKAPGYIAFVDSLPLTSTNKIKRGDLKALVATLVTSKDTHNVCKLKKRTTK